MTCKVQFRGWIYSAVHRLLGGALPVVALLGLTTPLAQAQNYTLLYSFQCGPNDGAIPGGQLTRDGAGNLYGTTEEGGAFEFGTVFELPSAGGETVLHSFAGAPTDGLEPAYTNLFRDPSGNLFGTTVNGGKYNDGTVFKLTPMGDETVLHSFSGKHLDGSLPVGGLIRSAGGILYGTTSGGGFGNGTVFQLTSNGVETPIYDFLPATGYAALGSLVQDTAGNFYGTTNKGGTHTVGTVFKLSASGSSYTILHSFGAPPDGETPYAGLVRDPAGNLYGTTPYGGAKSAGTVFEVTAAGKEAVLYGFAGAPDGAFPIAALVRDQAGNLYGVAAYGGSQACYDGFMYGCGILFKVTRQGQESVLYSFAGTPDGANPVGQLLMDSTGDLYGTTSAGGTYGCGTVFKYTP